MIEIVWPRYKKLVLDEGLARIEGAVSEAKDSAKYSDQELENIRYSLSSDLEIGFCIGGCCLPSRSPEAVKILFNVDGPSEPERVVGYSFWGAVKPLERTMGFDTELIGEIASSGKWRGTPEELDALFLKHKLTMPYPMPIREAIDMMHSVVTTTIKMMKFSSAAAVCGGPVELAVITTDRPFRWVKHKDLGAAI